MASQWTPPPNGTPCGINIYAKDVQRAKQFYSTVFNWNFRNESVHEGVSRPADQIVKFHFPGLGTGGGITKLEANEFISTKGKGGATLFLYVDDLETYIHVSQVSLAKLISPELTQPENHGSRRSQALRPRAREHIRHSAVLRRHRGQLCWPVHLDGDISNRRRRGGKVDSQLVAVKQAAVIWLSQLPIGPTSQSHQHLFFQF